MIFVGFSLAEVVKDLKEADPNMSQTELFEHCIAIGRKNGMETDQITEELMEILK